MKGEAATTRDRGQLMHRAHPRADIVRKDFDTSRRWHARVWLRLFFQLATGRRHIQHPAHLRLCHQPSGICAGIRTAETSAVQNHSGGLRPSGRAGHNYPEAGVCLYFATPGGNSIHPPTHGSHCCITDIRRSRQSQVAHKSKVKA